LEPRGIFDKATQTELEEAIEYQGHRDRMQQLSLEPDCVSQDPLTFQWNFEPLLPMS
jgi:hypothetical protein